MMRSWVGILVLAAGGGAWVIGGSAPTPLPRPREGVRAAEVPGLHIDLDADQLALVLAMSPVPAPPPSPGNRWADDPAAAWFGQRLFHDLRLSDGREVACSVCHQAGFGFSDGLELSVGLDRTDRNAPTLWNAAHQRWQFWDGRSETLWEQATGPIESEVEMGFSRLAVLRALLRWRGLRRPYEAVFGALPSLDPSGWPEHARPVPDRPDHPHQQAWAALTPEVRREADRALANVGKALEAYQRRIQSRESPFDHFVAGLRDRDEADLGRLSESAQRGLALFVGEARCVLCHHGPTLSNGEFHNLGLAGHPDVPRDIGRRGGVDRVGRGLYASGGAHADAEDADRALMLRTLAKGPGTLGAFKTPSLREVAESGPYMHDGSHADLERVVRFYSELDEEPAVGVRDPLLEPLRLSEGQIADLVAFLEALSGEPLPGHLIGRPRGPMPASTVLAPR